MRYSVVICVFNGGETIDLAVGSVLAASRCDVEIVVVDDASTDDTAGKLARYGESLRVLRNESNIGHARSWGRAMAAATGEFVVKLDADDWLLPNYFQRMDEAFDDTVGLVIPTVYDYLVTSGTATLRPVTFEDCELSAEQFRSRLLGRIFFRMPGVVLRHSLCLCHGGPDHRVWHDDWEYLLRVSRGASVKLLSSPLAVYRIHDGSMSGTSRKRNDMLRAAVTAFVQIVSDPFEEAYLGPAERRVFIPAIARLYLRIVGSGFKVSQILQLPDHIAFAFQVAARGSRLRAALIAFFPIAAIVERSIQRWRTRRFAHPISDLLPPANSPKFRSHRSEAL